MLTYVTDRQTDRHSPPWYLINGNEESTSEPSDTGNDGRKTKSFLGESTDHKDQEGDPRLIEGNVHDCQLAIDGEIIGVHIYQLELGENIAS